PKAEWFGDHLLITVWTAPRSGGPDRAGAGFKDRQLEHGEVTLVVGHDWLLAILRRSPSSGSSGPDLAAAALGQDGDDQLLAPTTPMRAAYRVLAALVAEHDDVIADIDSEMDAAEAEVFDDDVREDHKRIYRLRRRIDALDRSAG